MIILKILLVIIILEAVAILGMGVIRAIMERKGK